MSTVPTGTAAGTVRAPTVLAGRGLSKRFGDLQVLTEVDFSVGAGEAVGIVGPNGAGKTTLLNVLSGSQRPSAGRIEFNDQDITGLRPELRCRRGIGRAFQVPKPFTGMTVLENVLVGASYGAGLGRQAAYRRCVEVLETCGLAGLANRRADSLGLLHRKRLELARSLATAPQVLLLDEIGGGLTDAEADELVATIKLVSEQGTSIVWIEHIVHVLIQVVDRLVCMDAGRVIADGPPGTVLSDAVVVDAYLGRAGS
ncbi:ATP-binding cassette domain-containing protein [Actinomadura sp. LD22]|uniref:ATP-binding cassette domain-containing protein n=1 Tax=Actinomadura physcomitrii TaxID=2650748 RepID=A0A6I4MGU6_9ACTN|nr:ABC transporter ATP-binding protein [Actinomadura physcomitrii]MWA05388.1 ATP-binding cassette domain-containing protein [Actinomadura physcomitrii]